MDSAVETTKEGDVILKPYKSEFGIPAWIWVVIVIVIILALLMYR